MKNNSRKMIITCKIKLNTDYREYFILTNNLLNEALREYFQLLIHNENFTKLPRNECMRELEKLTTITKSNKKAEEKPKYYFEQDIPYKFRRAVISNAIGYAKVYFYNNKKNKQDSSSYIRINAPTVFYKGTYKYLENGQISFKLFNGEKWCWYTSKLCKANFTKNEKMLSPKVVIQKNCIMAHIPIEKDIDESKQQEIRKENNLRVCGVVFTNTNNFAVCVALNDKGELIKSLFISGGNKYRNNVNRLLGKIRKSNRKVTSEDDYKNTKKKIIRINQYQAHYISRKIIDFCKENSIKVISITESNDAKLTPTSKYRHIKNVSTPIELSKKIIECLNYKAKMENILIIKSYINAYNKCYKCLRPVKQMKSNNLKVVCEEGHKSDYYFNAAMNVGKTCLRKLGKRI